MCLADSRLFMPGLNLTYTDRASMAASTEVRVPFVDPLVFEAAFSLPGSEKIRGRVQKAALKDAARAWLPDEIIDRPEGVLRRAAAGLGHQRPARAASTTCSSPATSSPAGSCDTSRCCGSSRTSAAVAATCPSRCGSC